MLACLRAVHGWRYRRFVTAHMARSDADELAYTEQKIGENFSNYSAWHQRSLLLLRMHPDPAGLARALRSGLRALGTSPLLHHTLHDTQTSSLCGTRCTSSPRTRAPGCTTTGSCPTSVCALSLNPFTLRVCEPRAHTVECLSEDDQRALLEEEIRQCDELLGMEPDCVRLSTHSLSCSIFSPPSGFHLC